MPGFRRRGRDLQMSSNMAPASLSSEEQTTPSVAIRVQNVSKRYQIYDAPHDRLKQFVLPRLRRMVGKEPKQYFREFSALNSVSFEVKNGETVGIIGRNGAGKSTLLQILCGTLTPTDGTVEINGRVAALLELGSGFNTEFSGRENIYLNAGVLGLSKQEIDARFNNIVAFADIGDFLDQPVKTYSSGMYVRLAFSVIVHVEADILIVDEALAVGDMAFQAKCMAKLQRLMESGATVIFVSHDISSVRNLCQNVLWLRNGEVIDYGGPESVIGKYVAEMHLVITNELESSNSSDVIEPKKKTVIETNFVSYEKYVNFGGRRYGDGRARIGDVLLMNSQGQPVDSLELHEKFTIRFTLRALKDIDCPAFGYSFRDFKGNQIVGAMSTNIQDFPNINLVSNTDYIVYIRGVNNLVQGSYTLNIGIERVVDKNTVHQFLDVIENALVFRSIYPVGEINVFPAMVWQDVAISVESM